MASGGSGGGLLWLLTGVFALQRAILPSSSRDFNEGRVQFAFAKVKDPNTALPKNVLIAWCGGGVPERTKGYFTSHTAAVAKVLHGYHVQITARSDSDLEPDAIIRKVSDASGAKYTAGGSAPLPVAPPPVAKKPVFTPTAMSSAANPLVAARNRKQENIDEDGWGADAPPVTRSEIQKVESAYKPTKVNMAELTSQKPQPSRLGGSGGSAQVDSPSGAAGGGYQPVGKVNIAAIRAAANYKDDSRPVLAKGAYEPVGKVDIAAIRARAQKPAEEDVPEPPSRSLADRGAPFSQPASERLTALPKPKVANKFGGASSFTGTKAPTPGALGFGGPSVPTVAPVGSASRTFADQGGKTPAQIWAEKKARQGGSTGSAGSAISPPMTSPITAQRSGSEWRSGYSGKSWAPVLTSNFSRSGLADQKTGEEAPPGSEPPESPSSGGAVSALRDRFKGAQPMGQAAPAVPRVPTGTEYDEPSPAPPIGSRPSAGFQLPGLPSRPAPADEEEEEEDDGAPESSPVRIAVPVPRGPVPEFEPPVERLPPRPIPTHEIEEELHRQEDLPDEKATHGLARGAAAAVAEHSLGHPAAADSDAAAAGGMRAVVQYDYEKAEDNELELREGDFVTNIEMVDDDWWMGTNSVGESGLFPSNYVELVEHDDAGAGDHAPPPAATTPTGGRARARACGIPRPRRWRSHSDSAV